jgi:hypothetical protein
MAQVFLKTDLRIRALWIGREYKDCVRSQFYEVVGSLNDFVKIRPD